MIRNFILIFAFLVPSFTFAQSVYTQKDKEICTNILHEANLAKLHNSKINEIVIWVAKKFIGTDYEASTLDKNIDEHLVIRLTGLDCYTFLENTLVLSRCIKENKTSFEDYQKELVNVRYRNGVLTDYTSRLHYFSDWIYDCSKRKIIEDITKSIGGEPYKKAINFMSTHPASYLQLKDNPVFVNVIAGIEKEISQREYYYIPKEKVALLESKIKSGDFIAITTSIEGLDISHVGIAIKKEDGRIHLIHAPNVGKKVQISELPLAEYLAGNKKQTGIMVIRILPCGGDVD